MRRSVHVVFRAISQLEISTLAFATVRPSIGLLLIFLSAAMLSCENQPYNNRAATASIPETVNTAELKPSLTITYPESNAEDDSAFIQVAENSATVVQVRAQDSDGSKLATI